jgi:hypothetical protein
MDAFRKAAQGVSSGIRSLDGAVRAQAQERVANNQQTTQPGARWPSPEALGRAGAPPGSSAAPSAAAGGAPGSPAGVLSGFGTPAATRAAPPSLMDAPAGGGAAPGAAAALQDLYGDLSALRSAALASPATPHHAPPFDVSALADMLRIDLMSRHARRRKRMNQSLAALQRAARVGA